MAVVAVTTGATDARMQSIEVGVGTQQGKTGETCLGGLRSSTADSGARGEHDLLGMTLSECGIDCGYDLSSARFVLHENLIVAIEAEAMQAKQGLTEQTEAEKHGRARHLFFCGASSVEGQDVSC